jgi:hypothetical protein
LVLTREIEIHVIRSDRRPQVRPTCAIFEQYEPYGQNLRSIPGQAEPIAQYFFKNSTTEDSLPN